MNPVEIEEAISVLAEQPFDPSEFPYAFLEAFGNKATTIKRLRTGNTNASDIEGGVLQRNNIHIAVATTRGVTRTLTELRNSPTTKAAKAKFILATDGDTLEAEELASGDTLACDFRELPDHFGFFLPLAGITTVQQIRENSLDIRATSRLNRLYMELLKVNPEWGTAERRTDMNHFMARLIFSFFAEDTGIFSGQALFTQTVQRMSTQDSSNTHEVIETIFNAMARTAEERAAHGTPSWADKFPYVNGGLFSKGIGVPVFSRAARSYLLHVGGLDWQHINPDIFGSMTQAIADENERGNLGMHYTSVPNILKVLNPLFLDELRAQLEEAGDNPRKLLNLRNRISRLRVFDPACGGGNFLVIAYKQLREIEAEINRRRNEPDRESEIPLTNFRGIEIQSFAAEIARLALIIAEYQCDVLYRGNLLALNEFLPLESDNWITTGNALRLDWLKLCPPTGTRAQVDSIGLFPPEHEQAEIDFKNEGGETYICGNPPYVGSKYQSSEQKADLEAVFSGRVRSWRKLDYVTGWFMKAADYGVHTKSATAFVTTNSVNQGEQVPILWPAIFATGHEIHFAHTSFKWANLASHNAVVTVAVVGITIDPPPKRLLFSLDDSGLPFVKEASFINAYLAAAPNVVVTGQRTPLSDLSPMTFGNKATDGGHLILAPAEVHQLKLTEEQRLRFIRRLHGSADFIRGFARYCLWIEDEHLSEAVAIPAIKERIDRVRATRLASKDKGAQAMAARSHQFREMNKATRSGAIVVPRITSENREYLPVGYVASEDAVSSAMFAMYDAPLWNLAVVATRLHYVWIDAVCGKMKTDFHYSNTMGWNTFPVPTLTDKNKADLTRAAEDILLAREVHFPATIAELYDPEQMPVNLREAHERNDEILERIFIGRRFKNDTERLEKLFGLYRKASAQPSRTKVSA